MEATKEYGASRRVEKSRSRNCPNTQDAFKHFAAHKSAKICVSNVRFLVEISFQNGDFRLKHYIVQKF